VNREIKRMKGEGKGTPGPIVRVFLLEGVNQKRLSRAGDSTLDSAHGLRDLSIQMTGYPRDTKSRNEAKGWSLENMPFVTLSIETGTCL
jgi:hypothetical protein